MLKHIPNTLTVLRLVLAVTGALALWVSYDWSISREVPAWLGGPESAVRSLGVFAIAAFLIAAVTDYLDGWLARRWKVESALGAFLDPIGDKLLVDAYLIVYTLILEVPVELAVPVAALVARDLFLTFRRLPGPADDEAVKIPVSSTAKLKTALAMVVAALPLLAVPAGLASSEWLLALWIGGVWLTAALSLATALEYFRRR
ncbi:CDP-alcohol phosphatidyltransferase family protein [Maricaulis sp. CAU 1757]